VTDPLNPAPVTALPVTAASVTAAPLETARYEALLARLREMAPLVVAFSGGVDSSFLLRAAVDAVGASTSLGGQDPVRAVIGVSPSLQASNLAFARRFAADLGVPLDEAPTNEFANPAYIENGPDRCYHCKDALYGLLRGLVERAPDGRILDGTNHDDLADVRPGRAAARLHGVESPLAELGWTKLEIRDASRRLGLTGWDRPASPCLSSRIPHGTPVTIESLARIARAEDALHRLGFLDVRVRHHGDVARIEAPTQDFTRLLERREAAVQAVQAAGYRWVTLDLHGYRPAGQAWVESAQKESR